MTDKLHRFQLENLNVRGQWVALKTSWQEIQQTSDYPSPVKKVLGEALAAISLLANSLKFDGALILQVRGTYPLNLLVVQASSEGKIRGMASWQGQISEDASYEELFGSSDENPGTMLISVEPNNKQGERYQSLVPLMGDSMADSLQTYFEKSQQLNTRIWLAVDDDSVTGLMLQSLPSADSEVQENGWQEAVILANTITDEELLGLGIEELLHRLYHEQDVRLYSATDVAFQCTCSQFKVETTVRSLGESEVLKILEEEGSISVSCDFCNTNYTLDSIDIERLFSQADSIDSNDSGSIH